jgi:hypothetical protein
MLTKSVPEIAPEILAALSCSAQEHTNLVSRHNKLFKYWVLGPKKTTESYLGGHYVGQNLYDCCKHPLSLAILADKLDYFSENLNTKTEETDKSPAHLHNLLMFSYAVGAQHIATWLLEKLSIDICTLNQESKDDLLALVGSSGNTDWLGELLAQLGETQVPDQAFRFAALSGPKLKRLQQELQQSKEQAGSSQQQAGISSPE